MNAQSDNFERMRQLLALKRYEQPPPGYFDNLSARIINRIESTNSAQPSLWERLGFAFGSRPAFVCAMGVVACGLLIIGVLSTLQGTTANALAAGPQLAFDAQMPMMSAPEETRSSIEPVLSHVSAFSDLTERTSYTPSR